MQPLHRTLSTVLGKPALRSCKNVSGPCLPMRSAASWLHGRPPAVNHGAGTVAAFYYRHIRDFDIPTKDHIAAWGQDLKMTVSQFDRQVYAYAVGMLEAWSLKRGHKVGIWCINEVESAIAQYAAALIGVEAIVIDPAVNFAGVKQLINAEKLRALILSPRYGDEERHEALAKEFEPELEYAKTSAGYQPINSKSFRTLRYLACTSAEFVDGVMRFNELPVYGGDGSYDHDNVAVLQEYIAPSQTVLTYYSAGPGGAASKVRSVTHAEVLAAIAAGSKALGLTGSDVVLSTAPVWTFAGLTGGVLSAGSTVAKVVLPGKTFSAAETLKAAELHRPTLIVSTPEHMAAVSAEAAVDAAKPADKQLYAGALEAVRAGVLVTLPGAPAQPVSVGSVRLTPVDAYRGF